MAALLVWLELGLSIPKFEVPDKDLAEPRREGETALQSVPRNGGEKNYLEYIFKSPKVRTTCMYGVLFITLGNLTGNAVAFGIYVMEAAGVSGHDSAVRGLAVASLTSACLLHGSWRQGGIVVNNLLAFMKVLILLTITIIGFAASAGASFGHGSVHGETFNPSTHEATSNFDTHSSFSDAQIGAARYVESILLIVYTYSGFEQPFYVSRRLGYTQTRRDVLMMLAAQVLSEVSRPKKIFAKSTIAAMSLVGILFTLVNIAYVCRAFPSCMMVLMLTCEALRCLGRPKARTQTRHGHFIFQRNFWKRRRTTSDVRNTRPLNLWKRSGDDFHGFSRQARNCQRGHPAILPLLCQQHDHPIRSTQTALLALEGARVAASTTRTDTSRGALPALDLRHDHDRSYILHSPSGSLYYSCIFVFIRRRNCGRFLRLRRSPLPPVHRRQTMDQQRRLPTLGWSNRSDSIHFGLRLHSCCRFHTSIQWVALCEVHHWYRMVCCAHHRSCNSGARLCVLHWLSICCTSN